MSMTIGAGSKALSTIVCAGMKAMPNGGPTSGRTLFVPGFVADPMNGRIRGKSSKSVPEGWSVVKVVMLGRVALLRNRSYRTGRTSKRSRLAQAENPRRSGCARDWEDQLELRGSTRGVDRWGDTCRGP